MKQLFKFLSMIVILAFTITALGMPASLVHASSSVLYVETVEDGHADCRDWDNPCNLQYALANASSGDEIWVAAGTYLPSTTGDRTASFQLTSGVAVYGGFVGTETTRNQRNWNTNVVLLSGDLGKDSGFSFANNGENSYHVVIGADNATLDGVTISGGNANGSYPNERGGGMEINSSNLTIANVIFTYNSADYWGGGLFNYGSSPTLTNLTFSSNRAIRASNSVGGGMAIVGGGPTLTNITFKGNSASVGGGLEVGGTNPTLTNVVFGGNSANYGGGIDIEQTYGLTLTNVTFSGNSASISGGGIYNKLSSSNTQVRNSILWGDSGGEIVNDGTASPPTIIYTDVQGGYSGTGNIDSDPTFTAAVPSAPSTGGNLRLTWGSPAINHGYNGVDSPSLPATDLDGHARIIGGTVDMGGYEYDSPQAGPALVVNTNADRDDGVCGNADCSLREAINKANSHTGADSITFSIGDVATILLNSGLPGIADTSGGTTIDGGAHSITIDGNHFVQVFYVYSGVTFNLVNLTIANGYAHGDGGGLRNLSNATSLFNITFNGNFATYGGGGLENNSASPTLNNVTFDGNTAPYGGGMANYNNSSPFLINVTFNGNTAYTNGGGMENSGTSNPTLTNLTFSGNTAPTNEGGGIYNASSSNAQVQNSILWGDSGGEIVNAATSSTSVSYSIVQGGYTGGTNVITTDPLLGAWGYYGGLTQTIPLLPGSSAINAGNPIYCAIGYDERGVTYVGTCDIGAFESRGFTLTKTGGDSQSAQINTAFILPLALTVTSPYSEPVNGGVVTFTAPSTGASTNPATNTGTIAGGAVSGSLTANGTTGPYTVTASASGAASNINFSLTNINVPTATTNAAATITTTGATLNGTVKANYASTTVTFQYGLTTSYGSSVTATQSPVSGSTNTAVSKAVTGLTPNTTYHFRVVATNSAGTTNGSDLTFKTLSGPAVGLSPTSLSFGNQLIGTTSAAKTVTLTDNGSATLNVGTLSITAPYKLINDTCSGKALAPAAKCTFQVDFAPTASGATSGAQVTVPSNASGSPSHLALSGTGVAGTQLLTNADFETDANSDKKPDNWTFTNFSTSTDQRDCTVHYTGSCSLKLAGNNTQKTAYQTVTKSGGVAGDDYTFSLWSKASSVSSAATYQLQVQFLNGSTVISTKTLSFTTGNHAFQKVSGTFTATRAYTKITFTIVFKAASGTAWFDTAALNYAP